jgi:hypothetical protein
MFHIIIDLQLIYSIKVQRKQQWNQILVFLKNPYS